MADITQRGQLTKDDSNVAVGWTYATSTATGSTIIKSKPGVLGYITFNKPTATTIVNVYDASGATAGTSVLGITVPASPMPVTLTYKVALSNGLVFEQTTAASNITISYI